MLSNKKLNVLIVSEHASKKFGGEAMLPVNYFRLLSETEHTPYLITHARVKPELALCDDLPQDRIFYVPDTRAHQWLYKVSQYFPERISLITFGSAMHFITQFYQWKLARKIVKEKKIDVVHEPAPVSAVQPSAMFALGAPVIIGPMNGGMEFPPAFKYMSSRAERSLYLVMRVFSSLYNLIIPGKLFAKALLVANPRTAATLPKLRFGKVVEIVENGVFSVVDDYPPRPSKAVTQILYVGRLVDWKMVEILIEAVQQCTSPVKLTIVGDGPMRNKLTQLAEKNPNTQQVIEFTGMIPHHLVQSFYDQADIFVLPSVRECGGAVVLEAMSRGLAVIATAWGGPADYLTSETGVLIPPSPYANMVADFASHIDELAQSPELRVRLGTAAIQRVREHFTWDKKLKNMISIYHQIISG